MTFLTPGQLTSLAEISETLAKSLSQSPSDQVLGDVLEERSRQDARWGEQNHNFAIWMAILGEEYGECCQEALRLQFGDFHLHREGREMREKVLNDLRDELVQTAAVCVAAVECLDRNEGNTE